MSSAALPLAGVLPQFGQPSTPDALISSSPIFQALLAGSGGPAGLQNVNSLAASNPGFGGPLSFLSPGGGLNPQQSAQFGPLFGLLMSLWGGGQPQGGQNGNP